MAGANAHLMLIYNFHQIGENWLRIGWELSESWNSFLLGKTFLNAFLMPISVKNKTYFLLIDIIITSVNKLM